MKSKPPIQSEHDIQKSCVAWFRWQYPKLAGLLFAIPNGGQRSKATAGKLKAEGVVAGVADMFLSVPASGFHGCYIEMKINAPGSKQTPAQKEFEVSVLAQGYFYYVCRDLEGFMRLIQTYLATR